jgi:ABC-type oligopeptide transport system substrate-binding subunit/class 3 adenylate cyclase
MGPDEPREERRVVTVVVADLVGSTALGERLDPEELRVVVGDAVARMVGAVEAFGGTVKDLAGDGVLALFGAPTAHEDDPERAIRAALRIVEDVGEYAHEVERAWAIAGFGVRVGVSSGPVVTGPVGAGERVEYGATGDTVNVAARLESSAEPGQVLVGDEARRLTGSAFTWGEPVELDLKGKADPVRASAAIGVTGISGRRREDDEHHTRLVGREPELAVGMESVAAALAGSGHVLFLTGEPGIGKTRLLAELRAGFEEGPAARGEPVWLEGRCVSYGESMPYWPFRDLLRSWLGLPIDEPELRIRVALQREVARLFGDRSSEYRAYLATLLGLPLEPDDQARIAELSPEAMQYRTFEVVRHLISRLAKDGPVAVAIEDLHWADPTSLQLLERMLPDTEELPLLVLITSRPEPAHPSWRVKECAERELAHRTRELVLSALGVDAGRALLGELVGSGTLPASLEARILEHADGNPFFLEELVRSLMDAGALRAVDGGWRFDHDEAIEVPPTVEKVILARIDRLDRVTRDVLMAASVLGRRFGLALLEAVAADDGDGIRSHLTELQRADLIREGRRWPEPEYRFKHALIQETAYRTLIAGERERLHRRAAGWLEARYAGAEGDVAALLAYHWLGASDRQHAARYLTIAGDRARQEYALDEAIVHYRDLLPILEERGERREIALVLFKLALALHMSLRFAEANAAYQRAFDRWDAPEPAKHPAATLRLATSFLPNDPDPRSAIAWPNIQLCMQLFDRLVEAWPERTIVPSLADRWDISDDGLRYVFHLREDTAWSDGTPLTAHDVEFGIKRVLNPDAPGSSVAIYFVLENGQDYYLRHNEDADRIGVRALDDRTVEFRLVAPAPYFLSVMNRPDGGPQPRHAIEADPEGWSAPGRQVVSGPFRVADRTDDELTLERREGYGGHRMGDVARLGYVRSGVLDALGPYDRDELDMVTVRYTPRVADLVPRVAQDAVLGPAAWSAYLAFDHADPMTSNLDLRKALAHAIDRGALTDVGESIVIATGGIVPPALQGHTPDIVPPFDPDLARRHLAASGLDDVDLTVVGAESWVPPFLDRITQMWREVLGIGARVRAVTIEEALAARRLTDLASIYVTGWLPGYADPEYFLRLLFHSDSRTNEGGFSYAPFDDLIERARQERSDGVRLRLYHEADRMAVAERVAVIPILYGRSMAFVKPWVDGWWEFGKSSANFADLRIDPGSPRAAGA